MSHFMNKKNILILLGIVAVLGIGVYFAKSSKSRNDAKKFQTTGHVKRGPIIEAVYGIGTVTPRHKHTLKLAVSAPVQDIWVEEGVHVKTGQRLLSISGVGTFSSPINGVVSQLNFEKGEMTFPQAIILSIDDPINPYLLVSLDQKGAYRVKNGQNVRVSFDSLGQKFLTGKVTKIYSKDTQFLSQIDVQNIPTDILPGMTADVAIEVGKKDSVLLVPVLAVSQGFVTKMDGKSEERIPVKVGVADSEWIEVISDQLKDGDVVKLRSGS